MWCFLQALLRAMYGATRLEAATWIAAVRSPVVKP